MMAVVFELFNYHPTPFLYFFFLFFQMSKQNSCFWSDFGVAFLNNHWNSYRETNRENNKQKKNKKIKKEGRIRCRGEGGRTWWDRSTCRESLLELCTTILLFRNRRKQAKACFRSHVIYKHADSISLLSCLATKEGKEKEKKKWYPRIVAAYFTGMLYLEIL